MKRFRVVTYKTSVPKPMILPPHMNDYVWKLDMLVCYGCGVEMCLKDDDVKCWTRRGESQGQQMMMKKA